MRAPCQDCPDREPACHDRCERFLAFRAKLAEAAEEKKKRDAATPELCRTVVKQIWKGMKK